MNTHCSKSLLLLLTAGSLLFWVDASRPPACAAETGRQPVALSSIPGAARPGWYLGLGAGGAALDLDESVEARFDDLNLDLSATGQGGSLFVGYSFSNRFALELRLSGRQFSTGREDIDAALAEVVVEVIAPLLPEARVTPYLAGSLGGGGIVFEGEGVDDRGLLAGQVGFGGGVEVHLSRRFALDFHYRAAVQHYETEVLTLEDGSDERIEFEGSGVSQLWGMRVVFSF